MGRVRSGGILALSKPKTLPQVYETMHYYLIHRAEIDQEKKENTEDASRRLLRKALGEKKYREIIGV